MNKMNFFMITLLVMSLNLTGCSKNLSSPVIVNITKNTSLSQAEKDYANRYYRYCIEESGYLDDLSQRMEQLGLQEPYTIHLNAYPEGMLDKWGIKSSKLSLEEKAYADRLVHMVKNWESYQKNLKAIDMENLTKEQETLLRSLHGKYGAGPINLRSCWTDQLGSLADEHEEYLRLYKALTGHENLSDKEFLALR